MLRIRILFIAILLVGCNAAAVFDPAPLPSPTIPPPSLTPVPSDTHVVVPTVGPTRTATASQTLLPTITHFVTAIPPTASEVNMRGLWRVRHDVERDEWGHRSRLWQEEGIRFRGLPETVRINGGRGTVQLPEDWVAYLDKINSPDARRFLRRLQTGWLNYGPFPKMEQLTFGGDYVFVTHVEGERAYIKSFNTANPPPYDGPDMTSPYTMSHDPFIQIFSTVYTDGTYEMATSIGLVFTFVIANPDDGPLWIDIHDLIRKEVDGTPLPPAPTFTPTP